MWKYLYTLIVWLPVAPTQAAPVPPTPPPNPLGKAWLGIHMTPIGGGVLVNQVVPNSPAEKAKLQPDDKITKINSTTVTDITQVQQYVSQCRPGAIITLHYTRGDKELTARIMLQEKPPEEDIPEPVPFPLPMP